MLTTQRIIILLFLSALLPATTFATNAELKQAQREFDTAVKYRVKAENAAIKANKEHEDWIKKHKRKDPILERKAIAANKKCGEKLINTMQAANKLTKIRQACEIKN